MQTDFLNNGWLPEGYKPFSQGNYNKYSNLEQQVIEKICIELCEIHKNPDKYGIDLIITKDNDVVGGIEVESHAKYWMDDFPFKTVHFLGRKKKFDAKNNFYLMLSANAVNCVFISFGQLKEIYLITQDNDSCRNEPIYDIPKENCIFGWSNVNKYLKQIFNSAKGINI